MDFWMTKLLDLGEWLDLMGVFHTLTLRNSLAHFMWTPNVHQFSMFDISALIGNGGFLTRKKILKVHSPIPPKHWPPEKETVVLGFFESISPICLNPLQKLTHTHTHRKVNHLITKRSNEVVLCLPTCANKKSYHKSYIWTMNLSDMVFNVRPSRSSHWLYLTVLLQTSKCHHPELPKNHPKRRFVFRNMCPANCFGPPPKKIHQIYFNGFFLPNQMFFWGLRYPFTNDIDGSSRSHSAVPTVLVIDSLMAKKYQKPHWFLKGNGSNIETGKNLIPSLKLT